MKTNIGITASSKARISLGLLLGLSTTVACDRGFVLDTAEERVFLPVGNLQTVGDNDGKSITLRWAIPEDETSRERPTSIRVIRRDDTFEQSALSTEGIICDVLDDVCVDTTVVQNTAYFYSVFALYADGSISEGAFVEGIAQDVTAPNEVTDLSLFADGTREVIELSWQHDGDDVAGFLIRRKEGSSPRNSDDGDLVCDCVFDANADTQTFTDDQNLVDGTRYFYAAFAYDDSDPNNIADPAKENITYEQDSVRFVEASRIGAVDSFVESIDAIDGVGSIIAGPLLADAVFESEEGTRFFDAPSDSSAEFASDTFIARYDDDGNLLWARHLHDITRFFHVIIHDVTMAADGTSYVVGEFDDEIVLESGSVGAGQPVRLASPLESANFSAEHQNIFLYHLDVDGSVLEQTLIGAVKGDANVIRFLLVNEKGVVAGASGLADFFALFDGSRERNVDTGDYSFFDDNDNLVFQDASMVFEFGENHQLSWVKSIGDNLNADTEIAPASLELGSDGTVYAAMAMLGERIQISTGNDVEQNKTNFSDENAIFVFSVAPNGAASAPTKVVAGDRAQNALEPTILSMRVRGDGGLWLVAAFDEETVFSADGTVTTVIPKGSQDIAILATDDAFAVKSFALVQGNGVDDAFIDVSTADVDENDGLVMGGSYIGPVVWPVGDGFPTEAVELDGFVARLDTDAQFLWLKPVGSEGDDTADAVCFMRGGQDDRIRVAGNYSDLIILEEELGNSDEISLEGDPVQDLYTGEIVDEFVR